MLADDSKFNGKFEEFAKDIGTYNRKSIEDKITEINKAVSEKDVQKAEDAVKALEAIWNPIAEGLYKEKGESGEQNSGAGSNPFDGFSFGPNANPFQGK